MDDAVWGAGEARIAGGYRLDSQSIFSQLGRPLFTGHMSFDEVSPVAEWLGAECDRAGRLKVKTDLSVESLPRCRPSRDFDTTISLGRKVRRMPDLDPFWKIISQRRWFETANSRDGILP